MMGGDVQQETPDELVGGKGHRAIPRSPGAAVILVAEGDAALVESDEAAVCKGDAVGVACEIGEHGFTPGKGRLGINQPVLPPQRRELGGKGRRSRKPARSPKKASRPAAWASAIPARNSRRNRRESTRTGNRKLAGTISSASRRAISRRPARSYGHADGGSLPSPSYGARRRRRCGRRGAWDRRRW